MRMYCTVLLLLTVATTASAQNCTVGTYADPLGQSPWVDNSYGVDLFSFHVVMFAEDVVAGAAYRLDIQGLGVDVFMQSRSVGPTGDGLFLDEPDPDIGTNIALTECIIGFGGSPILIESYVFFTTNGFYDFPVNVEANTNQHPTSPVYVTCNDVLKECEGLAGNWPPLAGELSSFGQVKSLFHQ